MSTEDTIVVDSTSAATPDSAPVQQDEVTNNLSGEQAAQPADSAPAAPVEEDRTPKHIEELKLQRKKRQEAERQADYYRGLAEGRGVQQQPQVAPPEPQPLVKPSIDQFETYEAYEAANDAYLVTKAKQEIFQEYQQMQVRQKRESAEVQFKRTLAEESAKDPTFGEIVNDPTLAVSQPMLQLLQVSDIAPDVIRWLSQNKEDAKRISDLPPILAAKEMGAIEARIKYTPKPTPPKQVSAAPQPINTLTPSTPATVEEDDLPMEEYYRRRTKQMLGR